MGGVFLIGFPAAMAEAAVVGGKIEWNCVLAAALISLAIGIGHANWLLNELTESTFLAVSSVLPVSDQTLVTSLTRAFAWAICATLIPALGFFSTFAWAMTESWSVVAIAAGLAIAQAAIHAAVGLIAARWFPRWCNPGTFAALVMFGLFLVFGISWLQKQGLPNVDFVLRPLTMCLPTGWSLMCLIEAGINDSPMGWWYLLPVGLVVPAAATALNQLRDAYRIDEFELLEGAVARVNDQRGYSRAPALSEEVEAEPRPLTDLRAEVRSRRFLTTNPENGGLIERMFYDMLSAEERRSVDVLTGGKLLDLTRRVTLVAITVVVLTIAAVAADVWLLGWGGLSLVGFAGWLAGLTLIRRPETAILIDRSMLHCGTMALLPVDWVGFHRVVNLAAILQSVFLLPLSLLISGIGLWALRGHLPWFEAVSLSFKPLLVLVALHQLWMQFLIPMDVNADRVMRGPKPLCDSLLMILFGIGTVWLFFVGFTEVWSVIATGLLFGSGWLHRRFYRWLILRRHTELVVLPQDVELTGQMKR